jgi:hypothetical protein
MLLLSPIPTLLSSVTVAWSAPLVTMTTATGFSPSSFLSVSLWTVGGAGVETVGGEGAATCLGDGALDAHSDADDSGVCGRTVSGVVGLDPSDTRPSGCVDGRAFSASVCKHSFMKKLTHQGSPLIMLVYFNNFMVTVK